MEARSMSEISERAAGSPVPGSGQRIGVTDLWHRTLEQVGRFAGSIGSALAIIGFALPIGSGWYQVDGYRSFLLLLLMGKGADTSHSGGLGWEWIPLVFLLGVAVL